MAAVLNSCASLATTARQLDTNYAQLGGGVGGIAGSCLSLRGGVGVGNNGAGGGGHHSFTKTSHHLNDSIMYPSLPKYHRSSSAQQTMTTPNQHHQFSSSLAYGMPVSSGYSSQHSTLQKSYNSSSASIQRANTASDVCRNYWGHSQPTSSALYRSSDRHQSKRKSAVELLAESKPYFVKSDTPIMDRTNFSASTLVCSGKRNRNSSSVILDEGKYNPSYGETTFSAAEAERRYGSTSAHRRSSHMHHHHHHSHNSACHGPSNNSGLYQGKFRMSMSTDAGQERDKLSRYRKEQFGETIILNETKSVSFEEDVAFRIPPPLYFSQQTYGNMYDNGDEPLVLTENYRPISPPAEYAEDSEETHHNESRPRYNYQRSYSHSHEMAQDKSKYTAASYNINSHKSLPDLHTQINRHSPHSEILSCCSRGNRSIKSAGESSLNRDSGGSSGHYTHRSEPCYRQHRVDMDREPTKKCCSATTRVEYRRDSGSSTQHSNNSYCDYSCKPMMDNYDSSDYLLNFTTPEVPEAFQDDYIPPSPRMQNYQNDDTRYYSSSAHQILGGQGYMKHKASSDEPIVQSPGSQPSIEDISPPPIQFKRQKCIRFKNHNRISLPQQPSSANDVPHPTPSSMDSYRRSDPPRYFFPKCFSADDYQPLHFSQQPQTSHQQQIKEFRDQYANNSLRRSQELLHPNPPTESIMDLEKFFDRLGLNDDKFHEIYTMSKRKHSNGSDSDNSTVFFSDVSTVDSMRLPDSTETQPQATQTYRPTEPPSIVERNARIIKWLCNIRKVQNDLN